MKLEYLPYELQQLKEALEEKAALIEFLKGQVQLAPCLVSRPGEGTYECRHDKPCRVCEWRRDVHRELIDRWNTPDGIW
jgi:hypothetical protein